MAPSDDKTAAATDESLTYDLSQRPEAALARFVQQFFSASDGSFPEAPTTAGASSYALLADAAGAPPAEGVLRVLELGCGDGRLLARLARRWGARVSLTGVDVVPRQLERARRTLTAAGADAALLCAPAHSLPVPDASVDRVLVHMGLALMTPLEDTLGEIGRILRPGGVLAAVIEGAVTDDTIDGRYIAALRRTLTEDRPALATAGIGDRRAAAPDALGRLVQEQGGMIGPCETLDFELLLRVTPEEFIAFAEGDHLWRLLSPCAAQRLRAEIRALFAQPWGAVTTPIAMRRVLFRKPG